MPRDIAPRMRAKIKRAYARGKFTAAGTPITLRRSRIENLSFPRKVDAFITSPPYMNALDYRRDNRLRLWFLDKKTESYFPEPTDKRLAFHRMIRRLLGQAALSLKPSGYLVMVVGETVNRKRTTGHPSSMVLGLAAQSSAFELVEAFRDTIPDVRRARRDCQGTKTEHVLVFRKK